MEGDGGLDGVTSQDVWEGDDVTIYNSCYFARETGGNWIVSSAVSHAIFLNYSRAAPKLLA